MRLVEIKKIASDLGVKAGKRKKTELIHAIQKIEGHNLCYGAQISQCGEMACCWREDCFAEMIRPIAVLGSPEKYAWSCLCL